MTPPTTYAMPPQRDSPEFLKAPGAAGVCEMDDAVAKRQTTLKRYASEVAQWTRFCSESGYDPSVCDWDAFDLFAGWMLDNSKRQNLTSHVTALNHHFCQFRRYRGRPPLRAELGPLVDIKKKYAAAYLKRQADPGVTPLERVRHSALDSWFSPTAITVLVDIALKGAPADGRDAAEILAGVLFGCRAESTSGWLFMFSVTGHLEIAFGQWKTLAEARLAFLPARSIPAPADPQHPRAQIFDGIRRALAAFPDFACVSSATSAAKRITGNVRRLLPSGLLMLPGNRTVSAKSMRKTMASACGAAQIPFDVIRQHGLWSRNSTVLEDGYVDRNYPMDPMVASIFDWLMPVLRAPHRMDSGY